MYDKNLNTVAPEVIENRRNNVQNETTLLYRYLNFSNDLSLDCHNNKIPCLSNADCLENCKSSRIGAILSCQKGYCSTDPAAMGNENECDIQHGIINVFVGHEFIAEQTCMSTYRDIFTDNNQLIPYVCQNGVVNVNLLVEPFTVDSCTCPVNTTKLIYQPSKFNRVIPVCIPNNLVSLYSRIYDNVAA